ncbi:unnamed protein product, partial [Scytosiphon promiscuus]
LSLNERILDAYIGRSLLAERFGAGLGREHAKAIGQLYRLRIAPYLTDRAKFWPEFGPDLPRNSKRFQAAMSAVDGMVDEAFTGLLKSARQEAIRVAKMEAKAIIAGITKIDPVIGAGFAPADPKLIASAVRQRPFATQGGGAADLKGWYRTQAISTKARIRQTVVAAVTEGEPIPAIARRIRGTKATGFRDGAMAITRKESETVARTVVQHAMNTARSEVHKANADLLVGETWTTALDGRVCPRCGPLDGEVYGLTVGPRAPLHPRCRCGRVPVIKGLDELPPELQGTRSSVDGQVPASVTFEQWLKRQPSGTVSNVLGRTRADAFLDGKVTLRELLGPDLQPLTLDALAVKFPAVF